MDFETEGHSATPLKVPAVAVLELRSSNKPTSVLARRSNRTTVSARVTVSSPPLPLPVPPETFQRRVSLLRLVAPALSIRGGLPRHTTVATLSNKLVLSEGREGSLGPYQGQGFLANSGKMAITLTWLWIQTSGEKFVLWSLNPVLTVPYSPAYGFKSR